jgi:hypothetical protein
LEPTTDNKKQDSKDEQTEKFKIIRRELTFYGELDSWDGDLAPSAREESEKTLETSKF